MAVTNFRKKIIVAASIFFLVLLLAQLGIYATGAYQVSERFLKNASDELGLGRPSYVVVNPLASRLRISGGSGSAELGFWLWGERTNVHAYVNAEKRLGEWCIKEAALNSKRLVVPPC